MGDPASDLVVEVDVTSLPLCKLPIYARLNVPEVWHYADGKLEILGLVDRGGEEPRYEPITGSLALAPLTRDALARFVEEGLTTEDPPGWMRGLREWARRDKTRGSSAGTAEPELGG